MALAAALFTLSSGARADITHIVQHGHTIEAIAHRYRVTAKAILDANHLADPKHLKPGQTLVIPGVDGPTKKKHGQPEKGDKHDGPPSGASAHATMAELERAPEPRGHAESDTIRAVRLTEDFHIRVKDSRGHVPPSALKAFERLMRQGNATHPVDPRLVTLVGIVFNHFGGKTIDVVSGYRAYTPTQYSPHSNHNYGKAIDFRIRGVKDEDLRDFCRTLRSAGCGYYPNGAFVHLDVRDTKTYWVDWSQPGEPPKYDRPGVLADEGTSEVADDNHSANTGGSSETQMIPTNAAASNPY
ncbi:MAG: DUF882 domain-containing protein [Myxococcota bacterium]|nr:DUF882 domain-containing protein [Myxococcota bacterium]